MNKPRVPCSTCQQLFQASAMHAHVRAKHLHVPAWNKGLSKETDVRVAEHSRQLKGRPSSHKGCKRSPQTCAKVSAGMRKVHAEGRGWHIGTYRNNRTPSYPEQFFAKVIENEYLDKDYVTELRFGRFAVDFAWPHKKLAIEIDGEHHQYPDMVERDNRKDALLISLGWKILRLPWKEMRVNTKPLLATAFEFVHGRVV